MTAAAASHPHDEGRLPVIPALRTKGDIPRRQTGFRPSGGEYSFESAETA